MKFEYGENDCQPGVVITKEKGELVVIFEGFSYEEAQQWFNSKAVMSSFEVWQSVLGDFEMAFKIIKWEEI